MDLTLRERERPGELRCPYCFDDVAEAEGERCDGCAALLHVECLAEAGGCPTRGCSRAPGAPPAQAPEAVAAARVRAIRRPRRPRVRCYGCSERLGEDLEVCSGCGWAFHPTCSRRRTCCPVGEAERTAEPWPPGLRDPRATTLLPQRLQALLETPVHDAVGAVVFLVLLVLFFLHVLR